MADPNLSSFIWSVADLLRGDFKQSEYGRVILPFTVLRRLDCVLEKTKAAVLTTRRSPFWRTIRLVVRDLQIHDGPDWPSYIVWSNLYKVSPSAGGNPSPRLCHVQQDGCVELLNEEIAEYRPRRVLFVTGGDWAEPFLPARRHERPTPRLRHVTHLFCHAGIKYVVAVRPERRREKDWAAHVVTAFGQLG